MTKTLLLPDINVWIAMTFDSHKHHPAAKIWFDNLGDNSLGFCRLTQQGFLRLCSNPKVAGTNALSMIGAWQAFDTYMKDPRISLVAEPPGIEALWRSLTQSSALSTNIWSDTYLAAFCLAGGYELVTFDKGFAAYPGLIQKFLV
jgi:toxin-antitoxin system PIN domain toxin